MLRLRSQPYTGFEFANPQNAGLFNSKDVKLTFFAVATLPFVHLSRWLSRRRASEQAEIDGRE